METLETIEALEALSRYCTAEAFLMWIAVYSWEVV